MRVGGIILKNCMDTYTEASEADIEEDADNQESLGDSHSHEPPIVDIEIGDSGFGVAH